MPKKRAKLPLSKTHPKLAKQAYEWDAKEFQSSYSKKLNWKCSKGHVWDATIRNRINNQNCPYCSSHRILQGFNDLQTTHPDLASEADGWDPKAVISEGNRNFSWQCKIGHKYQNSISNRKQGQGCPFCIGKRVLVGFNDLKTLHPGIAREANGWNPGQVTSGSGKRVSWRCIEGHTWLTTIAARVSQGTACPYCSNYKTLAGYNDLATTHPEIAKSAFEWDPTTLGAGSGKRVAWICNRGHVTHATVESRAKNKKDCAYCSNRKVLKGFNDLGTTFPEIARQSHGWNPQTLTAGSNKKVEWICKKGHIWKQTPVSRTQGSGCPYCAGFYSWPGFNDLATLNKEIAAQADGWDPSTIGSGSGEKKKWKCELGHTWEARVNNRAGRNIGCPYCSGNLVWVGFNDLATTHPELAKEADGWDPRTIVAGHNSKKSWKCEFGHKWKSVVSSRATGVGCPTCSIGGFDPNKNGWLYLMEHKMLGYLQIGITNFPDDRLKIHHRDGWELLDLRGPMKGYAISDWETSILKMLRTKSGQMGPPKKGLNQRMVLESLTFVGTEMWVKNSFPVKTIKELMRLTEEFEEDK